MTDLPWLKIDVQETIALTDLWTDEQAGAHQRLCLYAWTTGGLPLDPQVIRRIRRWTPAEWKRIWPIIGQVWVERDGRLVHPPLDIARTDAQRRSESARVGGTANALANAQRTLSKRSSERSASVEQTPFLKRREEEDLDREERESHDLPPLPPGAELGTFSTGQLRAAAPGLVGAWNNIAAVRPPLRAIDGPYDAQRVGWALKNRPDIDAWSAIFVQVAASDYLRGLVPGRDGRPFLADFWWCLTHADEIASGRYDNRAAVTVAAVDPNTAAVAAAKLAAKALMR